MPTNDRPAKRVPDWRFSMRIARTVAGTITALLLILGMFLLLDAEPPASPEPVAPLPPYSSPIDPSEPVAPLPPYSSPIGPPEPPPPLQRS